MDKQEGQALFRPSFLEAREGGSVYFLCLYIIKSDVGENLNSKAIVLQGIQWDGVLLLSSLRPLMSVLLFLLYI